MMNKDAIKLLLRQPKFWTQLLLAAVLIGSVGYTGRQVYQWIFDRGVQSLMPQLQTAQRELQEYQDSYQRWVDETKQANEAFRKQQAALRDDLQRRLEAEMARTQQKEVIYRETVRYVPAEVDAATTVPFGFVWMYAATLQGSTATDATLGEFSDGPGGNAGADSGFALSTFAQLAGSNNVSCVRYRDRVTAWELWYERSKEQFEKAQALQLDHAPTEP